MHFRGELPEAELSGVAPIRISYHGNSHYNSLVPTIPHAQFGPPLGLRGTGVIRCVLNTVNYLLTVIRAAIC